jgi:hypothetical protein
MTKLILPRQDVVREERQMRLGPRIFWWRMTCRSEVGADGGVRPYLVKPAELIPIIF